MEFESLALLSVEQVRSCYAWCSQAHWRTQFFKKLAGGVSGPFPVLVELTDAGRAEDSCRPTLEGFFAVDA